MKKSKIVKRPSKVVGVIPPAVIEVPISAKQAKMVEQAEAAAREAISQRNTVLNTIAAAASYDGECNFLGLLPKDGKFYILLEPVKREAGAGQPAPQEPPAAPAKE